MPAKPSWYSRINDIIRELEALPRAFVDRATVEFLLGVSRRRAQQIMAPCIMQRLGSNGLADRDALVAHLARLANGNDGYYERQRRQKVATVLTQLRTERLQRPQLLVQAPVNVIAQDLKNLPQGVQLEPGRIIIAFDNAQQALEKLLAFVMAVSNDFDQFERQVRSRPDAVHDVVDAMSRL